MNHYLKEAMDNSFTKVKKSKVARTRKSAGTQKGITELDILRRAYEIYMETGVPYASEIEGLYEIEKDSDVSLDFKSLEGFTAPEKNQLQL